MTTLDTLNDRFDNLENRFDRFENKFDVLCDKLDARFIQINKQFERIDLRFEQFDQKIDDRVDDLATMTTRGFLEVRHDIASTRNDIRIIDDRLNQLEEIT